MGNYNLNSGYGALLSDKVFNNQATCGKTFLVCPSTHPNFANLQQLLIPDPDGTTRIYSTLVAAAAATTASRNDIIFVAEGHTETFSSSTAITLSTAGVTIIGLGVGTLRPTFTLDSVATARINVTAANVTIKNCIFVANFADIATCFNLTTAKDFQVTGCEFKDTSSSLNFLALVTTASTSNAADRLVFTNNSVFGLGTTAATTPIKAVGVNDRWVINNNFISLAVLNNTASVLAQSTGKALTNLEMGGNKVIRPNTDTSSGGFLITADTTSTGMVHDNYCAHLDVAAAILATASTGYSFFNNLADGDADFSGYVLPAIGTN